MNKIYETNLHVQEWGIDLKKKKKTTIVTTNGMM